MTEFELDDVDPVLARRPVLFVLDASGLASEQIAALNEGLKLFQTELENSVESILLKSIDIAVVSVGGGVTVEQDFTSFENWEPPVLSKNRSCPMGEGIIEATELVEAYRNELPEEGSAYKLPQMWLLSSAEPTDMNVGDQTWNTVQSIVEEGTEGNYVHFFMSGIAGAGLDALSQLVAGTDTSLPLLQINEHQDMFREYFEYIVEGPWDYNSTASHLHYKKFARNSDMLSYEHPN